MEASPTAPTAPTADDPRTPQPPEPEGSTTEPQSQPDDTTQPGQPQEARERKATVYVILAQTDEQVENDEWTFLGTAEAQNERKAKQQAFLQFSEDKRKAGVKLAAVPARSWKPEVAREEEKHETVVSFD